MSRAARRHARRQQRRTQASQPGEEMHGRSLDPEWVARLRCISDRIAGNVRESRSIIEAIANAFEMSGDHAAELLGRYIDAADYDGQHTDGLLGWLATAPEDVTVGVETPRGARYVPVRSPHAADQNDEAEGTDRPAPQLTVTVDYPPGSSPLAEEGAVVMVPFALARDEEGRPKFDVRVRPRNENFSEEDARTLMSWTIDYLRLTWLQHSEVLAAMAQSEPSSIEKYLIDEKSTINARGGAS